MKVFITGPPCSGKSHYAEKLAHHYNVPHIHMKQLLGELLAWDQEKEDRYTLAVTKRESTLTTIRAKRDERLAFLATKREAKKEPEKKEPKLDEEGNPIEEEEPPAEEPKEDGEEGKESPELEIQEVSDDDADKFDDVKSGDVPLEADEDDDFKPISIKDRIRDFVQGNGLIDRIPEEVINEAVRWRLERNDCQNRGYVLDGYPKDLKNAKSVFLHEPIPPKPITETDPDSGEVTVTNQEEIDNFKEKPSIYKHIFPESVVSLRATE